MSARICHLSSVHQPNDIRIFRKQCRSLAAHGYEVHFVVPGARDETIDGVHRWGVERRAGRLRRMTQTVFDVYRRAAALRADLYHFHDPELLPVGYALKLRGARVVFDSHEDLPRQILSKPWIHPALRHPVAWGSEAVENVGLRFLDAVIGATPHIAKRFADLGLDAVAVNNYPMLGELDVLEVDWSTKKRQLCYVGGLSVIRSAREMVLAAGRAQIPLQIAGPFSPASLREELLELPEAEHINCLGLLDRPAVAELLSTSLAGFVVFSEQPNHVTAQPNKLFEYLAGGIPVIASHFPLWRELVEGEDVGLCVDPADPAAIAEAMTTLATDRQRAEAMGRRGQALVRERCNWQAEEKTLITLYERLLS